MPYNVSGRVLGIAAIFLQAFLCGPPQRAAAQDYPSKNISIVVPFAVGGGTDVVARLIAERLRQDLNQTVIVDNRPGVGGTLGSQNVTRAASDGYTLLVGTVATHAIAPGLYRRLAYDAVKDFAPIALLANAPNILVVHPSLPAGSVKELIALAKAKPGQLNYGSAGVGSPAHLAGELFKAMAGVDMVHVPYRGGALAVTDLLSGRLSVMFAGPAETLEHVRAGTLRALAVTTPQTSPLTPDLPTVSEAGVPGFGLELWIGAFAPAGTPKEIVARLNASMVRALKDPPLRDRMIALGLEPIGTSPEEFAGFVKAEADKWTKLVAEFGITIE